MAFYIDDVPAEVFVIEPPETINLDDFDTVDAEMIAPDAVVTELLGIIDDETNTIQITQPTPASMFIVEGIHRMRIVLAKAPGTGAQRQALPEIRIVVQDVDSEWHTLDTARAEWPDAEHLSDSMLYQLLADVREQVLDFASAIPVTEPPTPVPDRYRRGQLVQARNTLNAQGVDPANGEDGTDTFAIRPFPLDWQVKQILRPKRGIPVVG